MGGCGVEAVKNTSAEVFFFLFFSPGGSSRTNINSKDKTFRRASSTVSPNEDANDDGFDDEDDDHNKRKRFK